MLDAYGWPDDLTVEQVLERLLALNKEARCAVKKLPLRAAEVHM